MKVCVGAKTPDDLRAWHKVLAERARSTGESPKPWCDTRMFPKRAAEILDGGSLYWTMGGVFSVRQKITAIDTYQDQQGLRRCRIDLDPELVPVAPLARRAFQGWRYLAAADAPEDIGQTVGPGTADSDGQALYETLSRLGLL